MRIKKGDNVIILTGANKGQTGRVLFVDPDKDRIYVEGMNIKKRHTKPTQQNQKGGIVSKEGPIHTSNVSLFVNGKDGAQPTRVGIKEIKDGSKVRRVRIARSTGEEL